MDETSQDIYGPENDLLGPSTQAEGFNSSVSTALNELNTSDSNQTPLKKKRKFDEIELAISEKRYKLSDVEGEEPFIKLVIDQREKPVHYYCQVCKKYFSSNKGGYFYEHIKKCKATLHPELLQPVKTTNDQKILFRKTVVQSASKSLMPLTYYGTESFKDIVQVAMNIGYQSKTEGFGPPSVDDITCSRRTLTRQLYQDVAQSKDELFTFIGTNVKKNGGAITIDMISKKKHYVGTVFHFIDKNWVMRILPIDIHEFNERSTAENITEDCKKLLKELNLEIGDIFIVTDEGSNVVAAFKNDHHFLCCCHDLHTVCKRSLDPYKSKAANLEIKLTEDEKSDLNRINGVIKTLKTVVNGVRSRLLLRNELSHALIVDCDTRWMTKLKMIRRFLKLTDADLELIEQTFKDDKKSDLINALKDTKKDREILQLVVEVFTPFETAIRALEAEKIPTLNLVLPTIHTLEVTLFTASKSDDHFKASLGKSASEVLKFKKKALITDTHAFALILDPLHMRELSKHSGFKTYKEKFHEKVKSASPEDDESTGSQNSNPFLDDDYIKDKNFERELTLYYQEKPEPKDYDLLSWWRKNENRFPTLSKLASEILSIPASSASIERLFSTLNLMTPAERSTLCNETIKNFVLYRAIDLYEK